jgi:multiple sugar transport system ATP-binding protein
MNCASYQTDPNSLVLQIENISKSYRGKTALDDIGFSIPPASFTVILGPAGAGKTTTLRLIAGLESPNAGSITLSGQNALPLQPKDRDVAMIFDNIALYPNKTGYENIASPLVIRKESRDVIEQKVSSVAATLQISHILQRLPKTMSGGERQRIALGRALIRSPKLFLLDEPLSSLDAKLRIELRAELRRLQKELGFTFILATPDFQEAMAIADMVIMLREGRIVQIAPPQELYDQPIDREVASFIGAPQINLVKANISQNKKNTSITYAGITEALPSHMLHLPTTSCTVVEIGIRPENIAICPLSTAKITATVTDIEPLGLQAVLTVQNSNAELRLLVKNAEVREITLGQNVGIQIIDTSRILTFDHSSGKRI